MFCTKVVLPRMLECKYGKINNISPGTVKCGTHSFETYIPAKSGILSFSKILALAVATSGINVKCVAPGCAVTTFIGGKMSPELQMMIDTKVL